MQHSNAPQFFLISASMIAWGFIQPFISFWLLKKFTKANTSTATAIAMCFGSVSVMTFAAGAAFLEKLGVSYQNLVIAVLAIMEVPAIFSGLFISKSSKMSIENKTKNLWLHTLFNKTILMIFLGLAIGIACHQLQVNNIPSTILFFFKPFLALFLFNMGLLIGKQRKDLHEFSWALSLFGFYMPLIGGTFGLLLSYCFNLDVGTGTLIAILSASASYIAAPAAIKIAIPSANEAIYLPLSLAIAFPFNVVIGIPLYYFLALKLLN